ncbi:MAG: M1 family metallopeptidase [bacterium]|nr:M1 family metallopeptidase [bacterium]
MKKRNPYLLPGDVVPNHYTIQLEPDLVKNTFQGIETIQLDVKRRTKKITFHSVDLKINVACIDETLIDNIKEDKKMETATLVLKKALKPGKATLMLQFDGELNDKLHGFYRSTYKNAEGQEKVIASTQFESTDARRAFPCWDEPAKKATFQITLIVDEGLTAISNARVVRETPFPPVPGKKEVVFATTMKMSTYLVAFIVGEFEKTGPKYVGASPVRVCYVPGKENLTGYGHAIGAFSLAFFSQYYNIPYPGGKLDLIAIPDFASGAMENLGAITFRETAVLVDENRASRAELERVADVVSHENAHMWFGDLVTMKWWNSIWLNEAFATFMEMLAVDAWKPEWRRWDSFTFSRAVAMYVDGLKSTRPIEFPVKAPEEAAGMFDVLTYEKGASILRMLEQFLEEEVFRDGIRVYLRRHKYGNAETGDLWNAIEDSSGRPVRALMNSWIFQPGYPLISVRANGNSLILSQSHFQYLEDGKDSERKWQVPVFFRGKTKNGKEFRNTALLKNHELTIEMSEPVDWVVVNAGGHGYYRTHYSPGLMVALERNLMENLLPVERFSLVNDTWATTLAGLTGVSEYLSLLNRLQYDTDINVWSAIISSCRQLNRIFGKDGHPMFKLQIDRILLPAFNRLGWYPKHGESELDGQLRGDLLSALGTLAEHSDSQMRAKELYAEFERNPAAVDRNLVPALVAIVAYTGREKEYEKFFLNFKNAPTPQEEQRYLFALADFRDPDLIKRTLELTVSGEVRTQNAPYLMRSLLLNISESDMVWSFMKSHWEEMCKKYPDNSISRMCEGITALIKPELEADVKEFFAQNPVKQGKKQISQHLEKLRIAVLCKERWNQKS